MRLLLLLIPFILLGESENDYGEFSMSAKGEYKSYSEFMNDEYSAAAATVDVKYKVDLFWGFNVGLTAHLNAAASSDPDGAGAYFGFNQLSKDNEDESGAYLGEASINYKSEALEVKTFHHYINTPFAKSDLDDILPTTFEGITARYDYSNELKIKAGVYSRIFGKGSGVATKRGEFISITESINGALTLTENYLTMLGAEFKDSDRRYGGTLYYYNLLESDIDSATTNDMQLIYIDGVYAWKLSHNYKVRRGNKIISGKDVDNIIVLTQIYHGDESIKNSFTVLGVKGIYRNSKSSFAYFVSLNGVTTDEDGTVRYPFGEVPEFTKTDDYDLSKLNLPKYSYKLEAKYYSGKDFATLYYGGYVGEDYLDAGVKEASLYGFAGAVKATDSLGFKGSVESQSFEGVNSTTLEDNVALSLKLKYNF